MNTEKTTVLALNCPALSQQIIKDIGYTPGSVNTTYSKE